MTYHLVASIDCDHPAGCQEVLRLLPGETLGDVIRRVALVGALLLTLAACDNATTGTVTSRQHVPQHDELSYFQCVAYDSKSNCAVQIPIFETVAECWRVNFHNDKDDEDGSACVDQRDYETYRLGDQFPHPR